jgi:hypothetical protein
LYLGNECQKPDLCRGVVSVLGRAGFGVANDDHNSRPVLSLEPSRCLESTYSHRNNDSNMAALSAFDGALAATGDAVGCSNFSVGSE